MGEKIEKELKWAVLGTGIIANEMAQALEKMEKNFMQYQTGHIERLWNSPKNMEFKKFMTK